MKRCLARIGALWACVAACSSSETTTPSSPSPAAATPSMPSPTASSPVTPAQLEAWMLACDGPALAQAGPEVIAAAAPDMALPSAGLLAYWESVRAFDASGHLASAAAEGLLERISTHLNAPVPTWWADHLASALRQDGREPPFYDGQLAADADRRGPWRSEHGVRLRGNTPSPLMVHEDRELTYDFSMGRATLAKTVPLGHMVEYDRRHAGTTVYYAAFEPAAGGFAFPLVAAAADGTHPWSTTVCGPNRTVLGGVGHLIVEVRVVEDPPPAGAGRQKMQPAAPPRGVAVFTAETHGVALEVFDIDTGKRTLAWSSDLWFARS